MVGSAGAGMFVLGLGGLAQGADAAPPNLDILGDHPRAFFFRQAEGDASDGVLSYEEWESRYLALDGIVGKVLNEENYYTGKNNLPFFRQFKQQNPRKMVLLHYNGTGRRVTDEATTRFFPGHFLHYRGTKLTQGITSQTQTVLRVQNTSVFDLKRYSTSLGEDIAITRVGSNGKPAWSRAEQVRLVSIDARNKTIRVKRGMYRTEKSTFPTGSYLAAHVTTGPYGSEATPEQTVPLWAYNFSTACPRDGLGRNCGDVLADYLGDRLGPGPPVGDIAFFDGIVFDVFSWMIRFGNPLEAIDVNTDGRADRGMIGGVNTVGLGVNQFLKTLRERLPDKLIVGDGHETREAQRGFGYVNGAESEGFPDKYDIALDHLSRGENIFDYWKANSAAPSFNFMNFRYKDRNPERWRNSFIEPNLSEDRSYRKLRLALASALFTDAAFTYGGRVEALPPEANWTPPGGTTPVRVRVFDELWKGTEQIPHWLGQPLGPPVHRAALTNDILAGEGVRWVAPFIARFQGTGLAFSKTGTSANPIMTIRTTTPSPPPGMSFTLSDVEVSDKDLFVSLRLRADPLEGFPASIARRVDVGVAPPGGSATTANKEFTWAGQRFFDASLYFQDVGPGRVDLRFEVEGERPVYFDRITAHSAADGRHREYEGGVVLANPSTRDYTFKVGVIYRELLESGIRLRRLRGTDSQDPEYEGRKVNDGSVVAESPAAGQEVPLYPLTLPAKDALFVVKESTTGG
ncbi:MAG: hypothetical protein ACRDTR_18990 [Rubrobacter sp.]